MRNEVIIEAKLDTKDFDREIENLQGVLKDLEDEYDRVSKLEPFIGQQQQLEKLSKKILKTKQSMAGLITQKEKLERTDLRKFEGSLDNVGKSINTVIGKVGKLALAVFSVRSAYSFVRNSVSTLSQYNEKMANDIENIRYALASTLQPIIEKVIDMVYKLLQYINYIANAWFGKNIFENANKNLKNANKSANELKKTLAGFDKINILSNNKTNTGTNAVAGVDLSKQLTKQEVPAWVQWIADHKDLIKGVTKDLLILFGAVTVAKVLKNIAKLFGASGGMGLIGLKEILAIIGTTYLVTIAVKGVLEAKQQLEELNKTLDNNIKQMELSKNTTQKIIDKYKELIETGKITDQQLIDYQNYLINATNSALEFIDTLESQKTIFGALTGENKKLTQQQEIQRETIKNLLSAYSDLYNQGKLDQQGQKTYKQLLEKTMKALADQGIEVNDLRKDYEKLTGKDYTITIKAKADTAQANKDYSNFFTKLGESVGVILNPTQWGSGFTNKLKNIWTGKKLAKGGIINMPGSGVPLGYGAMGGERGAEWVQSLTDEEALSRVGSAIGKHVTINADITLELERRVLARVQKEIQNNYSFIRNGG